MIAAVLLMTSGLLAGGGPAIAGDDPAFAAVALAGAMLTALLAGWELGR